MPVGQSPTTSRISKRRIIACRACHKRKTRCSGGGPPCNYCAETSSECVYPIKDKKTEVCQRYLDRILEENRRLSAIVNRNTTPADSPVQGTSLAPDATPRADNADRNPLIEERPWFMAFTATDLPIHIGEAADAAFATRLRQSASSKPVSHMPRVQYMTDDTLRGLVDPALPWPSPPRFRYLIDVALNTVCRVWHIVMKSVVLDSMANVIQDPNSCDWLNASRLWALLALGEAYSSRCVLPEAPFPGSKYFARAMSLIHLPGERPRLALIETYVLLSICASTMNRRHTASFMASYALRISIILGLHIEVSESQVRDRALREHRCRLWWTSYCFDRMWASKIGWPPSIPDESIEIGPPSDVGLSPDAREDLHDAEHIVFVSRLAKLTNNAVTSLYVRKRQPTSFSERVQAAVRALSEWADDLPSRFQLPADDDSAKAHPREVVYMHLSFNQSVIVTTRPILLHLLRQRRSASSERTDAFSESAQSLTTACIRCARNSLNLLKKIWTEGTVATFDYFNCQYIFSSATILALSCFLNFTGCDNDREEFFLAVQFLQQLECNGNHAAKEYYTHILATQTVLLDEYAAPDASASPRDCLLQARTGGTVGVPVERHLPNPPLQEFLNHPTIDLGWMDTGGTWLDWQDLTWPEMDPMPGMT